MAEEEATGLTGTFTATIGENLGEPTGEALSLLVDVFGKQMEPSELFIAPAEASNSLVDAYYTYQGDTSVDNYVADFSEGRSLMLGHDWGDQAVGYTFTAVLTEEDNTGGNGSSDNGNRLTRADIKIPHKSRAGKASRDYWEEWVDPIGLGNWRDIPAPGDKIKRVVTTFYIPRNLKSSKQVANDDVIRAIITRVYRDVSITFEAQDIVCKLCGRSVLMWECPHIPGCIYDVDGMGRVAYAETINAHAAELSIGFEGATPEASIVAVKARLIANSGRLSKGEAARLRLMEGRLGRRLVDDSAYRKVRNIVAPRPTVTNNGGNKTMARQASKVQKRQDATGTADVATLESAVADAASTDAESLAAFMESLNTQITEQNNVIAGINQQITDASAAGQDTGGLEGQLSAEEGILAGLQDELAAAQGQLDSANSLADATGGTTTDATVTTPDTTVAALVTNALRSLGTIKRLTANTVSPVMFYKREVTADDLQSIVDAMNTVIASLQTLVEQAGGVPPDTQANSVVMNTLKRSLPGNVINLRGIVDLVNRAKDGVDYRTSLIDDIVAANGRAYGPENVNEKLVRDGVRTYSVKALNEELARMDNLAGISISSGRHVGKPSLRVLDGNAGSTTGTSRKMPANSSKASRQARHQEAQ